MTVLDKILAHKRKEIAQSKKKLSLKMLMQAPQVLTKKKQVFLRALRKASGIAVIAEIKRKSPSKGLLRKDFEPVLIAEAYQVAGASALSILTDEKFFAGSAAILKKVKKSVRLPILRKDFIIDEYQIYESKLIGADAILLIAGALSKENLKKFYLLAKKIGLDVLFEVHSKEEMKKLASLKPLMVGINNRDLRTFWVDLDTTKKLIPFVPKGALIVSESGIKTNADLNALSGLGVKAVLVGESLIKEKNIVHALERLRGKRK